MMKFFLISTFSVLSCSVGSIDPRNQWVLILATSSFPTHAFLYMYHVSSFFLRFSSDVRWHHLYVFFFFLELKSREWNIAEWKAFTLIFFFPFLPITICWFTFCTWFWFTERILEIETLKCSVVMRFNVVFNIWCICFEVHFMTEKVTKPQKDKLQ